MTCRRQMEICEEENGKNDGKVGWTGRKNSISRDEIN